MCHHFLAISHEDSLIIADARFDAVPTADNPCAKTSDAPGAHTYPGDMAALIIPQSPGLSVADLFWGLGETSAHRVYNARMESVISGVRMWQEPLKTNRGIACAAACFENHQSIMTRASNGRTALAEYAYTPQDALVLFIPALISRNQFALITEPARQAAADIHHRMPLFTTPAGALRWLEDGGPWLFAVQRDPQLDRMGFETAPANTRSAFEQLSLL